MISDFWLPACELQQGEASGEEGRVGKQPLGRRGEGQRKGRSRRLRPGRPKATGLHPAETRKRRRLWGTGDARLVPTLMKGCRGRNERQRQALSCREWGICSRKCKFQPPVILGEDCAVMENSQGGHVGTGTRNPGRTQRTLLCRLHYEG